jgi:tRNA G18 (ribose-2'-O)-methylase SpoU
VVGATTGRAIASLGAAGLQIVAADPAGTTLPSRVDLTRPSVLFVGNEGAGLPDAILRAAALRVRIPMVRGVSSLNVHAALAALLYESFRQRDFEAPSRDPQR